MLFCQRQDVMTQIVGDEFVVLDLETNKLHRMNAVGALLWDTLASPQSATALANKLIETWPEAKGSAAEDAAAFLMAMQETGLVIRTED